MTETKEGNTSLDDGDIETMTDKSSNQTDVESGEGIVQLSSDDKIAPTTQEKKPSEPCSNSTKVASSTSTSSPFSYTPTKAPKDTLKAVYKAAEYKAGLPLNLLMAQSFMAGIYIAMAGHLFLTVGGGLVGASLFPTGLIAVVLTSAELFTGDALVFIAGVLGGRVTVQKLVRNWTVSWIMNFAGCLFWASLFAYASGALQDAGQVQLAITVSEKKAHQPWGQIFLKGIGANFMVCVGVWQATCAEEVAGKVLAIWFPIAAFVMMGFDHCIANQFLIPIGMMFGADVSVGGLFWALLPATIGNAVGGGLMVGAVYWYVYDSMASSKQLLTRVRSTFLHKQQSAVTFAKDGTIFSHGDQGHIAKDQ
jgi:formate/nitrite transporter